MLGIRRLERFEEEAPQSVQGGWGVRQGIALVGGVIVLVSLCLMAGLYAVRPLPPRPPSLERVAGDTERLSLLQSYRLWKQLDRDLRTVPLVPLAVYERNLAAYHRWMSLAAVVGVLGVLCAASSRLIPRSGDDKSASP